MFPATHSPASECDDEARLIEAIRTDGHVDLYASLVRRYQDRLFQAVYGIVGDRDVAEDLTQEAFIKAYLSLDEFRGACRFYSWLYRIAMNVGRDWLRHQVVADRYDQLPERQVPDTPEQVLYRNELAGRIDAAMRELPEKYREAFHLKHVEGLSYDEMAALLDLPVETLKVRVHRARSMLQHLLHEEAP
ncbi:MAG: sigma-70 family RNA polymerase sigma factor [Candidatus Latescibacteria bacterium]|nr:sigma-70 family RNA polymerase sigma factor [Candidatus Latescibacterota bacterium]